MEPTVEAGSALRPRRLFEGRHREVEAGELSVRLGATAEPQFPPIVTNFATIRPGSTEKAAAGGGNNSIWGLVGDGNFRTESVFSARTFGPKEKKPRCHPGLSIIS